MMSIQAAASTRGEQSQEKLIDAAIHMICERGIAGSSVDAISKRAGVVKTGLYWHFQSKDGLILAVIGHIRDRLEEAFRDILGPAHAGEDRLEAMGALLERIVSTQPENLQVLQVMVNERANLSQEVQDELRSLNRTCSAALVDGFSERVGRRDPDHQLLALSVISITFGTLWLRELDPEWAYVDAMTRHVCGLVQGHLMRPVTA
jgi:AcrR family transcriptional regulator